MRIATLVLDLAERTTLEIETLSQLPAEATYRFDNDVAACERSGSSLPAHKLVPRTVVSLRLSQFQSREVVRKDREQRPTLWRHSPELEALVPQGQRYGYDLIAHVGVHTLLKGRTLQEIHDELLQHKPSLDLPCSSLYDVQRKFLFYLGELHRQAVPVIKEHLQQQGRVTWLLDGTLEPGTPVFLGLREAQEGFLLACRKIATENVDDIASALLDTAQQYGKPTELLHDLSDVMALACERALPGVAHYVCHYHLARDIGEDLYQVPQGALGQLVRSLKLQARLKEQRRGQTEWFRENLPTPEQALVLRDLLSGKEVPAPQREVLGREVLFGFHSWILDFAADGCRQGFPFDPYLLYLHRRVVKASAAVEELLNQEAVRKQAPKVLFSFQQRLHAYLMHPQVIEAAAHYEQAYALFDRLRTALRLTAQGESPLRHPYPLTGDERGEVLHSLAQLREECRYKSESESEGEQRKLNTIVVTHLDRYWPYLFARDGPDASQTVHTRTTNGLEGHWGRSKQLRRQVHGRKKLTLDLRSLPEEYMLVPNLQNPRYVELVLGSLDRLPEKLAEAGRSAGPFSHWLKQKQPLNLGRLPKRILRKEDFVDTLIGVYEEQCQSLLGRS